MKWLVLALYYIGVALYAGEGRVGSWQIELLPPASLSTGGLAMATLAFVGLVFMDRNVFYFSFRQIGTACYTRIGAGIIIFYLFTNTANKVISLLLGGQQVNGHEKMFFIGIGLYLIGSLRLRYLRKRQLRFIHKQQ